MKESKVLLGPINVSLLILMVLTAMMSKLDSNLGEVRRPGEQPEAEQLFSFPIVFVSERVVRR